MGAGVNILGYKFKGRFWTSYVKFIRNWHYNHVKGPILQQTSLDSFLNSGFLNAVSGNILAAPA